uniref:Single-stranded DNA-binding protein n=1 Tax=Eiseniibacteriota bacterium TaxID=2212470 RepID=A0A832MMB1_UNCEI
MSHPDPLHDPENVQAEDVLTDVNEAHITGNVVGEPRLTRTPTGHEVGTIIVQTLRIFRANGKRKETVEHHHVAAWDAMAQKLRDLKPGNRVSVFGYLHTRFKADQETGVKLRKTEIVADQLIVHH